MAKEKSIEFIEILFTSEVEIQDNYLYQKFFYDKKYTKYLTEPYYILYNKLEAKLRKIAFFDESLEFVKRENDKGEIVLIYEILSQEGIKNLDKARGMFKLVDFVPPNPGCAFCIHKRVLDENFFYCEIKEKTMAKEVKTCRVFNQKRLYKT